MDIIKRYEYIDSENKRHIVYDNDLKRLKKSNIDVKTVKCMTSGKDIDITNRDKIIYRIKECEKDNNKYLDLSNLNNSEYSKLSNYDRLFKPDIMNIEHLHLSSNNLSKINDLDFLLNLKYLDCSYNKLQFIPKVKNSIIEIHCKNNEIECLNNIKNTKIKTLTCQNNKIKTIPFFSDLQELNCSNNQILKMYPMKDLSVMECQNNKMEKLFVNQKMKHINCSDNAISEIYLETSNLNFEIEYLNCKNNKIKYIPTFLHLKRLSCSFNKLKDMGKMLNLVYLYCANNEIEKLCIYSELIGLYCENNDISEIEFINNNELKSLNCSNNKISRLTSLPKSIENLNCSFNKISNLPELDELYILICNNNIIESLKICDSVIFVQCSNNNITEVTLKSKSKSNKSNNGKICEDNVDKKINCCNNNIFRLPYFENFSDLIIDKNIKYISLEYKKNTFKIKELKDNVLHIERK